MFHFPFSSSLGNISGRTRLNSTNNPDSDAPAGPSGLQDVSVDNDIAEDGRGTAPTGDILAQEPDEILAVPDLEQFDSIDSN